MSNIKSEFQRRAVEAAQRNGIGSSEERDSTDEAYNRLKAMLGSDGSPKKDVKMKLNAEEKVSIYQDVLDRLQANKDPRDIARDVVASFEEHLQEKQDESTGKKGPKGPIFRRSED